MNEFDYVIIGGGCAGLSLAYELDINNKLNNKTLAIIEPRTEYKRDKTWSFWKVINHNFDDCVIKSWNNFSVNSPLDHTNLRLTDFLIRVLIVVIIIKKLIPHYQKTKIFNFLKT